MDAGTCLFVLYDIRMRGGELSYRVLQLLHIPISFFEYLLPGCLLGFSRRRPGAKDSRGGTRLSETMDWIGGRLDDVTDVSRM